MNERFNIPTKIKEILKTNNIPDVFTEIEIIGDTKNHSIYSAIIREPGKVILQYVLFYSPDDGSYNLFKLVNSYVGRKRLSNFNFAFENCNETDVGYGTGGIECQRKHL